VVIIAGTRRSSLARGSHRWDGALIGMRRRSSLAVGHHRRDAIIIARTRAGDDDRVEAMRAASRR
jgi:hypothetical protein